MIQLTSVSQGGARGARVGLGSSGDLSDREIEGVVESTVSEHQALVVVDQADVLIDAFEIRFNQHELPDDRDRVSKRQDARHHEVDQRAGIPRDELGRISELAEAERSQDVGMLLGINSRGRRVSNGKSLKNIGQKSVWIMGTEVVTTPL